MEKLVSRSLMLILIGMAPKYTGWGKNEHANFI